MFGRIEYKGCSNMTLYKVEDADIFLVFYWDYPDEDCILSVTNGEVYEDICEFAHRMY